MTVPVWEDGRQRLKQEKVASGRAFRPQVGGGNAFEVNPRKKKKKKATIVTKNEAQFKRSV